MLDSHKKFEEIVCETFGVTDGQLRSKRKPNEVCFARYVMFRFLYNKGYTLKKIGATYGERDHSTVLSGLNQFDLLSDNNLYFKEAINQIRNETRRL